MGKRRTRKQKATAKHTYSLSWDDPATTIKKNQPKNSGRKPTKMRNTVINERSIKKDLAKSITAFVVILITLVIYSSFR